MAFEQAASGDLQTSTRITCFAEGSLSCRLTTNFHWERSLRAALGDTNMLRTGQAGSTSGARFTRSLVVDERGRQHDRGVRPVLVVLVRLLLMVRQRIVMMRLLPPVLWPALVVRLAALVVMVPALVIVVVVDSRLVHHVAVGARLVRQQGPVGLGVTQPLVREQRGQVEVFALASQQHVVDVVRGVVIDLGTDGATCLGAVGWRWQKLPPRPGVREAHIGDVVAGA